MALNQLHKITTVDINANIVSVNCWKQQKLTVKLENLKKLEWILNNTACMTYLPHDRNAEGRST